MSYSANKVEYDRLRALLRQRLTTSDEILLAHTEAAWVDARGNIKLAAKSLSTRVAHDHAFKHEVEQLQIIQKQIDELVNPGNDDSHSLLARSTRRDG